MATDAALAERIREATAHSVVIRIHRDPGEYRSAECQLGAHHGCPGGVRVGLVHGEIVRLYCQCIAPTCACWTRRSSSVEQPPGLDSQRARQR